MCQVHRVINSCGHRNDHVLLPCHIAKRRMLPTCKPLPQTPQNSGPNHHHRKRRSRTSTSTSTSNDYEPGPDPDPNSAPEPSSSSSTANANDNGDDDDDDDDNDDASCLMVPSGFQLATPVPPSPDVELEMNDGYECEETAKGDFGSVPEFGYHACSEPYCNHASIRTLACPRGFRCMVRGCGVVD